MHRRSLIFLFTDFLQTSPSEQLFAALQHLKHNKHRVVVFHVLHEPTESLLQLDGKPYKFIDVESGQTVDLYPDQWQDTYQKSVSKHFESIKNSCMQYQIGYVPVNVAADFSQIMTTYLVERQKFV